MPVADMSPSRKSGIVEVLTPEIQATPPSQPTPVVIPLIKEDPATCLIVPGLETTIEVQKGKTGLGLSIIGGSDTLLVCFRRGLHNSFTINCFGIIS